MQTFADLPSERAQPAGVVGRWLRSAVLRRECREIENADSDEAHGVGDDGRGGAEPLHQQPAETRSRGLARPNG